MTFDESPLVSTQWLAAHLDEPLLAQSCVERARHDKSLRRTLWTFLGHELTKRLPA
jgi:hypothetical protein